MHFALAFLLLFSTMCKSAQRDRYAPIFSKETLNATLQDFDRRFGFAAWPTPEPINSVSVSVNVIRCIYTLITHDFRGYLQSPEGCTVAPWNDVTVVTIPTRPNMLQRRIASWGLYAGLCYMIQNDFNTTLFNLKWNNQAVGVIIIGPSITGGLGQFDARVNGTLSRAGLKNMTEDTLQDDDSDFDLDPVFLFGHEPSSIAVASAFLAKAMTSAAALDISDRIEDGTVTKQGYVGWLQFVNRYPLEPDPYVFTYIRGIEAAWKVVKWLALRLECREYIALLKVNGRTIGHVHGSSGSSNPVDTSWN